MSLAIFLGSPPAMAAARPSRPGSSSPPAAVAEAAPRLLELVNRERAAAGLAALAVAGDAAGIAQEWSGHMARAGELSHNDDYFTPASMDRLRATLVGENVAFADTIDEIHDMFMHSPPHRKNILNPEFREVGFGAARTSDGLIYVTEDFLTRQPEPAGGRSADSAGSPSRSEAAAPASDSPRASSPRPNSRPAPGRPGTAARPRPGSPSAASRPAAGGAPRPVPVPVPARPAAGVARQTATPAPAPAAPPPAAETVSPAAEPADAESSAPAPTDPTAAAPGSTGPAPSAADAPSSEAQDAMPARPDAGASGSGSPVGHRDMLTGAAALGLLARIGRRR